MTQVFNTKVVLGCNVIIANYLFFLQSSLETVFNHLYPKIFPLHDIDLEGTVGPGRTIGDESSPAVLLPDSLPATAAILEDQGVYLIDDGTQVILLVNPQVDSEVLQGVFGCQSFEQFLQVYYFQPLENNPFNSLVMNVLEEMKRLTNNFVQPRTVVVRDDENYELVRRALVEDPTQSYPISAEKFMASFNQITQ